MSERPSRITSATGPITRAEWLVALVGLVLVAGTVGYLVWLAAFVPERPPDMVVAVEGVAPAAAGYGVELRVKNNGGTTAADLTVEATLVRDGRAVQTSEVAFDFVPPGSERFATVLFTEDPRTATLDARVVSFRKP